MTYLARNNCRSKNSPWKQIMNVFSFQTQTTPTATSNAQPNDFSLQTCVYLYVNTLPPSSFHAISPSTPHPAAVSNGETTIHTNQKLNREQFAYCIGPSAYIWRWAVTWRFSKDAGLACWMLTHMKLGRFHRPTWQYVWYTRSVIKRSINHNSLVKHQLEYCTPMWKWPNFRLSKVRDLDLDLDLGSSHTAYCHAYVVSHLIKYIKLVEGVQLKATKLVQG